ncbi:MAG: hypothetical protein ACKV2T_11500 [Kofleriaceae bacterium]
MNALEIRQALSACVDDFLDGTASNLDEREAAKREMERADNEATVWSEKKSQITSRRKTSSRRRL